jgi:hypothetical protein
LRAMPNWQVESRRRRCFAMLLLQCSKVERDALRSDQAESSRGSQRTLRNRALTIPTRVRVFGTDCEPHDVHERRTVRAGFGSGVVRETSTGTAAR